MTDLAVRVGGLGTSVIGRTETFLATFDQIASPRGRGGDLDSRIWSAGRFQPNNIIYPSNPNWTRVATIPSGLQTGFSSTAVYPPDDMLISNTGTHSGQLMTTSVMANYGNNSFMVRQPFDFTSRTGSIVIYVSGYSPSSIAYYVQLAVTVDPVPCPTYLANGNEETGPVPRHGLILPFKANQVGPPSRINIATASVYDDFARTALTPTTDLTGGSAPTALAGSLNRIEIRLSTTLVSVYISDYTPDGTTFANSTRLAWESDIALPFSTGYVHLGLRNHASEKFGFGTTGVYYWGSVGFDGPVRSSPRAYEIPDNTTTDSITDIVEEGAITVQNLGYRVSDGTSIAEGVWSPGSLVSPLTFTGSVDLAGATSAQLAMNLFLLVGASPAITTSSGLKYKFNGGTWRTRLFTASEVTGVNAAGANGTMGLLADITLADLQSGTNTVDFSSVNVPQSYYPMVANIDLLVHT